MARAPGGRPFRAESASTRAPYSRSCHSPSTRSATPMRATRLGSTSAGSWAGQSDRLNSLFRRRRQGRQNLAAYAGIRPESGSIAQTIEATSPSNGSILMGCSLWVASAPTRKVNCRAMHSTQAGASTPGSYSHVQALPSVRSRTVSTRSGGSDCSGALSTQSSISTNIGQADGSTASNCACKAGSRSGASQA